MKRICGLVILLVIFMSAFADDASQQMQIIVAKKQAVSSKLAYSGLIEPLTTQVVTSSEEGTIDKLNFQYGQPVKKDQLLFEVKSKKFQDDFVTIIKNYLTAKQQLHQSQTKLQEQEELWKYGLISRDVYTSAKTAYYNDELSLLQAQEQLLRLLHAHKSIQLDYEQLDLSNIDELKQVLYSRFQSNVTTHAPASGIALIPDKNANQGLGSDSGSAGNSGPVIQGSAVQQNQAVLSIGDLSGATINIDINEIYVNQIKPGLKAIVTSVAFPGVTLQGEVISVGSQAVSSGSSDIPTFPVMVKVPVLTPQQQQVIRVGMSVEVQLVITETPKILIPINAVIQRNGQSFVNVQTATGVKEQVVVTGETSLDSVAILSGLNEGDRVVLPH